MPTENIKETAEKALLIKSALCALFWATGWIVMYLNQIKNGEKFKTPIFIINVITAAWVGLMVSIILPEYLIEYKIPIVSMSWFLAHPLLRIIEERALSLIILIINKVLWTEKKSTTWKKLSFWR